MSNFCNYLTLYFLDIIEFLNDTEYYITLPQLVIYISTYFVEIQIILLVSRYIQDSNEYGCLLLLYKTVAFCFKTYMRLVFLGWLLLSIIWSKSYLRLLLWGRFLFFCGYYYGFYGTTKVLNFKARSKSCKKYTLVVHSFFSFLNKLHDGMKPFLD